jgi:hypothetical protein
VLWYTQSVTGMYQTATVVPSVCTHIAHKREPTRPVMRPKYPMRFLLPRRVDAPRGHSISHKLISSGVECKSVASSSSNQKLAVQGIGTTSCHYSKINPQSSRSHSLQIHFRESSTQASQLQTVLYGVKSGCYGAYDPNFFARNKFVRAENSIGGWLSFGTC